jgi:hypothetical protein
MSTKATTAEKRSGLTDLEFDSLTRKRAEWEAFEFTIECENQITVTNGSYGHKKDDHEYSVTVEQRDETGRITPLHCDCPAFQYYSGACKHIVATALHNVVLGAAVAYTRDGDTDPATPVLLADGGVVTDETAEQEEDDRCDEDWCPGPRDTADDPLPCFSCFRDE